MRAAQLIPSDSPALKDARFQKDRADLTGRSWDRKMVERMRPEALVEMRDAFEILEGGLLADGREWILGSEGPRLADVEGMFSFDPDVWLKGMLMCVI